jgi:glycosyltransferase involved in cell wall biosynthesis
MHVLAPAQFGGLERVVFALATGQQARGHHVHALAIHGEHSAESPVIVELRARGITVHSLRVRGRSYLATIRALRRIVAAVKPDVVHSHGYLTDVLLAVRQSRRSPPLVATAHGFTGGDFKNRLYEWLQIRSHRRFNAVIAVSGSIRDRLVAAGVTREQVHVLRNAWSSAAEALTADAARETLGVPGTRHSLGWIGRISREKGLDVLIRALPALSDLPIWLTIIGDGGERTATEALALELGVLDRIKWVGVLPEAARLLPAFDVLVLSSRTEGTPITLLEAMSASVPIVATSVGGVPEAVSPAEALLVPSEDPDALAAAIRTTLANPTVARERAARARALLESSFAVAPWLAAHERIYRDAISPETTARRALRVSGDSHQSKAEGFDR